MCGPDENNALKLPTALHLAARYGLRELTTRLLDLPDARYASAIANSDGHYPEGLARVAKRGSLVALLENFREVVSFILLIRLLYTSSVRIVAESVRKMHNFRCSIIHFTIGLQCLHVLNQKWIVLTSQTRFTLRNCLS